MPAPPRPAPRPRPRPAPHGLLHHHHVHGLLQGLPGLLRQPVVGHHDVGLVQVDDRADAHRGPLRVVRDHHQAAACGQQGPVGVGLQHVGRGVAGAAVHAVHPQEHQVQVQRLQRPHGDRADQGVRGRAHPSGEDDVRGRPGPALRAARSQEGVRDPGGVGDHREVGDQRQLPGQRPRRGAGREPHGGPGGDEGRRLHRDRVLLGGLPVPLGLEAGLVGAGGAPGGGAAVHLVELTLGRQGVEVAADGHVRDVQQQRQLADPYGATLPHLVQDPVLTLGCQHGGPPPLTSTQASQRP